MKNDPLAKKCKSFEPLGGKARECINCLKFPKCKKRKDFILGREKR